MTKIRINFSLMGALDLEVDETTVDVERLVDEGPFTEADLVEALGHDLDPQALTEAIVDSEFEVDELGD